MTDDPISRAARTTSPTPTPRPRLATGFQALDALLGGGLPEGLTVIVCDGQPAGHAAVDAWLEGLMETSTPTPRVVWSSDPKRAAMERKDALLHRRANVLVRHANKEGMPLRDDVHAADTVLVASASPEHVVITVSKNEAGSRAAVRFTYSNRVLAEAGVTDGAET